MRRPLPFAIVASALFVTTAMAQTPYAGMQTRPIKALSEQQVADLKAGRGGISIGGGTERLSGT